jgi:hypothetical protein
MAGLGNAVSERGDLRLVWVDPGSAQENPLQWRLHPPIQLEALDEFIFGEDGVGWAGVALINDRRVEDGWKKKDAVPTRMDGHAREKIASQRNEQYPALVGHWTEEQEQKIMAMFDPLGMLAETDTEVLEELLSRTSFASDALADLADDLAAQGGIFQDFNPDYVAKTEAAHGEAQVTDFWPWLKVRVSPETFDQFQRLNERLEQSDHEILAAMVTWADAKLK